MATRRRRSLPPIDPAQRYSIEETIDYLRTSRFSVYRDIKEGKLVTIKDRARTYVPGTELIRRSAAGA